MKTKYTYITIYATQGGGEAVRDGNSYVFSVIPDWGSNPCPYEVGDVVPSEWGIQRMCERYSLLPKKEKTIESRNFREGTYRDRRSYFNLRHKLYRKRKKKAKLALKGTLRSTTKPRIDYHFYRAGIELTRELKQKDRKAGYQTHFFKGDTLKVVNVEDCEEGLRLGDFCTMLDRTSELSDFIIVKLRRNGKLKQIEKSRFTLYNRHVKGT